MSDLAKTVDYAAITRRQQATWSAGDFNVFARQTMPVSEAVCRVVNPSPGRKVLDLACGTGNAALIAARRYCQVTGIDFVPELIACAEQRAAAEGVEIDFRVGDAQDLPFPDGSFDVVVSVFGVMFAPDQARAAREMVRVCRPGGVIALANHMPEGWAGDFFATHARYAPPPPGVPSPLRWGTDEGLGELLGDHVSALSNERRTFVNYFLSLEHAVETFAQYFGPTVRALQTMDEHAREPFLTEIGAVFARHNQATGGALAAESPYLLTYATRA